MALDGGYYGSFDHAIANLEVGRRQGAEQGLAEGFAEGRLAGWNEAVRAGNAALKKQIEFTNQHIADKAALQAQLAQQQRLIDELAARIVELERENATLRGESEQLRQGESSASKLVAALRTANALLQDQVQQLDASFKAKSDEHQALVAQYNRSMVFVDAVRGVMTELTSERYADASHVRNIFAEKYAAYVKHYLDRRRIDIAPQNDAVFARELPRTHLFINEILAKAASEKNCMQPASPEP